MTIESSTDSPSSSTPDAAAVRVPPPLVAVAVVAVAVLLQRLIVPLHLPLPEALLTIAGPAAVALGIAVAIWAAVLFRRSGQDPMPWKPTPSLLGSGPYRFTRNPMYLGLGLLQLGAGAWRDNGWMVLFVPLTLLGIYFLAVRHEEIYLEAKFGDAYREYKAAVRRWL